MKKNGTVAEETAARVGVLEAKVFDGKSVQVTIKPPNFKVASFKIRGNAPLVINRFATKAREEMRAKQAAGDAANRKKRAVRAAKDFDKAFDESIYRSAQGWCGIPAGAFRKSMIAACRTAGYTMTMARLAVFIVPDGSDMEDHTPLVKITKGYPEKFETMVRIQTTSDIRVRSIWTPGWEATVNVRFDGDMLEMHDVAALLMRAGMQVGIMEGRPFSKTSDGMEWGTFELLE